MSRFDRLPADLLYEVFDYLHTDEILYAFQGVSKRLDSVLAHYRQYDLKFESIAKFIFDFLCRSIQAEQVRSFIRSNNDDTYRQIFT